MLLIDAQINGVQTKIFNCLTVIKKVGAYSAIGYKDNAWMNFIFNRSELKLKILFIKQLLGLQIYENE